MRIVRAKSGIIVIVTSGAVAVVVVATLFQHIFPRIFPNITKELNNQMLCYVR